MKAEELMIGDYLYFPIGIEKVRDIIYVQGRGLCASFAASATLFPVEVDKLKPIPLTAEILEKNGFKKYGDTGWWLEDDYFDIQIYEWSDSIWVFKYESTEMNTPYEQRTFSYVHNLQHALRECGIDKELTIYI